MTRAAPKDVPAASNVPPARAFARALGAVLAETRRARGLTQEQVSEIAEFDVTYPSLVERGLREPKLSSFLRLCAALGRAPDDVLAATLALLGPASPPGAAHGSPGRTPPAGDADGSSSKRRPNAAAQPPQPARDAARQRTVPRREGLDVLRAMTPARAPKAEPK
jgi:transcriptional regulator with XRE-family HTH domain